MEKRPNIIIIYTDQMRADCLGVAGNKVISTPNMDRLAAGGVHFENAYVSFPLCCPWRASLMTGKYAHSTGMHANHYPIPLNQNFLAETLRQNGYQTGYVGKWHLNGGWKHGFVKPEERLGFERFIGFSRGHKYFDSIYYRDDDLQPRTSPRYEPEIQTEHLIEMMDSWQADPDGNPFFGMVCFGPPHPPLVAPEKYLTMYSPDEVPMADNGSDDPEKQQKQREFLAKYYGLVTSVDDQVGRIMDWLDEKQLADDTLILLVSDHGEMAGEHNQGGKKSYFRSSMQVPLIIKYPKRFDRGQIVPQLVDPSVDTMPMLLELCGINGPPEMQGSSYLSLMEGSDAPSREAVYYEILKEAEGHECFPVPERGVRTLG